METEVHIEMNRATLTLKGDLRKASDLAALQGTVKEILGRGVRDFTFNLDAVRYVDSEALGPLVQLYTTVTHAGGDIKFAGLPDGLTSLSRLTKLLGPRETESFVELPDPLGARLPLLNPVMWLVLLVTLAILVTIASRAVFSVW